MKEKVTINGTNAYVFTAYHSLLIYVNQEYDKHIAMHFQKYW
jgi:hypothetical protein